MKILLTELGNTATGDVELWAECCRQLTPDHEVTLLHRLADPAFLKAHGLGEVASEFLPLPALPENCADPESLDRALALADPVVHGRLHALVADHDVVAVAPGGKYLRGYAVHNALVSLCAARLQDKPYLILHQSVGPMDPGPQLDLFCALSRDAEGLLLRDRKSFAFMKRQPGTPAKMILTADPLFRLLPCPPGEPAYDVGLNFRLGFNGWTSGEDLLAFAGELKRKQGLRVLIYSTTHDLSDSITSGAEALGVACRPGVLAPPMLLSLPGSCRVNVTDSFHGSIFSLLSGRPVVMCQCDFDSWKLQGTFRFGGFHPSLHPGLRSPAFHRSLYRKTLNTLRNPEKQFRRQSRELPRLARAAAAGWEEVRCRLQELEKTKKTVRTFPAVKSPPRVVALIAAWNEERFIRASLIHLQEQGVEAVLLDNESTDRTVEIATEFLGKGLRSIETIPRKAHFDWKEILSIKSRLQDEIDADWFLHMDPDEFRLPPPGYARLCDWIQAADQQGYNAVDFLECTFAPCLESPDHDHPDFQQTLRWYYPFKTEQLYRLNAWKKQPGGVDLVESGGHLVSFPNLRRFPESGLMRHYLFLSEAHAVEKYRPRSYKPEEVALGWHGWRAAVSDAGVCLPPAAEMRVYRGDRQLDPACPQVEHFPFLKPEE
ncbi:MAG: polysaccharide pyruvyl transferase family protein [Kiritimatiellia bacterium]